MKEEEAARLLDRLGTGEPPSDLGPDELRALDEAEAGLRLLREAGEVPDPGDLHWRRFGRRVEEALPRRHALPGPWWLAAAAAVLAVSVTLSRSPAAPEESGWRALPEDDAEFEVLAGLGDEARALEPVTACPVEECVLELTEVESGRLASLLREALEGREL